MTIKLCLSHFSRLDRPKIPLFSASKWFQKFFVIIIVQFHASLHLNFQPGAGVELPETLWRNSVFMAFPANIFRPRRFEDTSKLLSANIIWTSESCEIFFSPSIRTKLWAKEAEEGNKILEVIFCTGYNIFWSPNFWYVLYLLWTLNVISVKLIVMHIIKSDQCFFWMASLWNFNLYLNEYSV